MRARRISRRPEHPIGSGWLKGLLHARGPLPAAMVVDDTDRAFEPWRENENRNAVLKVVRPLGNDWYVFLEVNDN